jgi:hypothetical protein
MRRRWPTTIVVLAVTAGAPAGAAAQLADVTVPEVRPPAVEPHAVVPEVEPPAAPQVEPPPVPELEPAPPKGKPPATEGAPSGQPDGQPPPGPKAPAPSGPASGTRPHASPKATTPATGSRPAPGAGRPAQGKPRATGPGGDRGGSPGAAGSPATALPDARAEARALAPGGPTSAGAPFAVPLTPAPSRRERREISQLAGAVDAREVGSPADEARLRKTVRRFRVCLAGLDGRTRRVIELRAGIGARAITRIEAARQLKLGLRAIARYERRALRTILATSRNGCRGGKPGAGSGDGASEAGTTAAGAPGARGAGAGPGAAPAGVGDPNDPGAAGGVAGINRRGGPSDRESGASPSDEAFLRRLLPGDGAPGTAFATMPLIVVLLLALTGGWAAVRNRSRSDLSTETYGARPHHRALRRSHTRRRPTGTNARRLP